MIEINIGKLEPYLLLLISIIVFVYQFIIFRMVIQNYFKNKNMEKLRYTRKYIIKTSLIYLGLMLLGVVTNLPLFGFILLGTMSNGIVLTSLTIEFFSSSNKQLGVIKNSKMISWFILNLIHVVLFIIEAVRRIKEII